MFLRPSIINVNKDFVLAQLNVSNSSTMKILYNSCMSTWALPRVDNGVLLVILCSYIKYYRIVLHIAKQQDRTIWLLKWMWFSCI